MNTFIIMLMIGTSSYNQHPIYDTNNNLGFHNMTECKKFAKQALDRQKYVFHRTGKDKPYSVTCVSVPKNKIKTYSN